MASPRIRLGKISENNTHMPGPSEKAKLATKPSMPISTSNELRASSSTWKPIRRQQHEGADAEAAKHQQGPAADSVDEQQRQHGEHDVHEAHEHGLHE